MKIRTFAEDFIVQEFLDLNTKKIGKYAIFSFTKKGWSTFDIISSLSTRFNIPRKDISIAGIKDRHALTISYISIPSKYYSIIINALQNDNNLIPNVSFNFEGFLDEKLNSDKIEYNKFSIVVRSIKDEEIAGIYQRYEFVKNFGVPNYYDDQRFGSARHGSGFVMKNILLNKYYDAAKLLFMTSKYDRKNEKLAKLNALNFIETKDKDIDYQWTLKNLPFEYKDFFKSLYEKNLDYLDAFKLMDRRYLILLFHAYQSYLYNELLSNFLIKFLDTKDFYVIKGETSDYLFPKKISTEKSKILLNLDLPIPSYMTYELINSKEYESINIKEILLEILKIIENKENIKLESINGKVLGLNIKNAKRKAYIRANNLTLSKFEEDDFFKGKKKVRLDFELEKGNYATLIIKGIFLQGKFGKAKEASF